MPTTQLNSIPPGLLVRKPTKHDMKMLLLYPIDIALLQQDLKRDPSVFIRVLLVAKDEVDARHVLVMLREGREELFPREEVQDLPCDAQGLVGAASLEGAYCLVAEGFDLGPSSVGLGDLVGGSGAERAGAFESPLLKGGLPFGVGFA